MIYSERRTELDQVEVSMTICLEMTTVWKTYVKETLCNYSHGKKFGTLKSYL